MKILETIEGASENTVVYENSAGEVISVSRPKIFTLERMIAEIAAKEKKSSPSPKGKLPKGSPPLEQASPEPPAASSEESKGDPAMNTPEQERRPE